MASRYEVEVTVASAKGLKNVNWRHGDLMPYAAVWVDPAAKSSTKVAVAAAADEDGLNDPVWDEKIVIPLSGCDRRSDIHDAVLHIDIVHANAAEDVKPLVGSGRINLGEILDEDGIGVKINRKLKLKRPSGRPQGKLEVKVCIRESTRYSDSVPYGVPYGQHHSGGYAYRDPYAPPYSYYAPPPPVGYPHGAPPPGGYAYGSTPPSGYPYVGAPPPMPMYGPSYGSAPPPPVSAKQSKFGMGTGLAVGAAAGLLGGLALSEGLDYVEDKIADDVAEKLEDDLDYDGDGGW